MNETTRNINQQQELQSLNFLFHISLNYKINELANLNHILKVGGSIDNFIFNIKDFHYNIHVQMYAE